jgi:glyoxylase-like metal-dependent hydrolase (beta-lactamase superfamily II)/rhodanese-related sulfurtransferase
MIFRQLFEPVSCTYTYVVASRRGGEALIIDPVLERVDSYIELFDRLDLRLVKAVDTHVHADHVTGLGALRDRTKCITVMGRESSVDTVSMRVADGETIDIEGVRLDVIYTPGHTDDSYSFVLADRVFTGDTLLIRGTGRTDFQNGSAADSYDSIFNKLLTLPDETLVYPAHDYKGETVSTIAEERAFNPRLQVSSVAEYADIMDNLGLANPKMMDVAVPANVAIGMAQTGDGDEWGLTVDQARARIDNPDVILVDLREVAERLKNGVIPGSLHVPYVDLEDQLRPSGVLNQLVHGPDKNLVFYCAYGERSALAVQTARDSGLRDAVHILGGIDAWKKAGAPLEG